MDNLFTKEVSSPIKVNVTRIADFFKDTDPYIPCNNMVIKDYIYTPQKRIIA